MLLERRPELAAAVAALAVHWTALGGGYVWLDHAHIEQGLALASPQDWPELFTQGFAGTGFYRPLVALSLSVDALLWKEPWFFRAVTLAWHAAAAAATAGAAGALGLTRRAALIAGLLFAIHPATELVADAIAFRSEAMITVSLCVLIAAHVGSRAVLAAGALFVGALVKETAWLLGPLFIAVLELERRFRREAGPAGAAPLRRRLLAAEAGAFLAATAVRLGFAPPFRAEFPGWSADEALGTRLGALARSAATLAGVGDRAICDATPILKPIHPLALGGGLLGLLVLWLAWKRRGPALLFAVALLPCLHVVPVMRFWSPHYLYVPLAFGTMLAAEFAVRAGRPALVGAGVLGVVYAAICLRDGARFRSDVALWRPEVSWRPECREGHLFLGDAARAARKWQAAAAHYARAAAPVPGHVAYADTVAALYGLGATRLSQKRFVEARDAWSEAASLATTEGDSRKLLHNLATLSLNQGDPAEAERLLRPETERERPFVESLLVRARALHALGRDAEAAALHARLPSERR
jgi:tetratricopeptide (TPR) repeat protein